MWGGFKCMKIWHPKFVVQSQDEGLWAEVQKAVQLHIKWASSSEGDGSTKVLGALYVKILDFCNIAPRVESGDNGEPRFRLLQYSS